MPALVGAPKPMVVLQAIIVGLSDFCAAAIAAAIACGSWPSMRLAFQPAGLEALHLIDRVGKRQRAVDRDAVVVEQHDQPVELQVAGERDRFLADAFHQVAVGGEHIGVVIDDVAELGGEMPLGDRHADRVGEALAERAGGGLDAGRDEIFRMARRQRAELAEALDLVERHRLVAGQIQQRIEQHRAVAGREHEAVAVGPVRIGGIELQELGEQHGRDVGHAHRHAGMAGFRLLHRVHGERADGVRHAVMLGAAERSGFGFAHGGSRRGHWSDPVSANSHPSMPVSDSTCAPSSQMSGRTRLWVSSQFAPEIVARRNYSALPRFVACRQAGPIRPRGGTPMNGIIYLVGLIVVIMVILSFLGLR